MRYPIKTSTKEFCDTIATRIAQYEKYRRWATESPALRMLSMSLSVGRSFARDVRDDVNNGRMDVSLVELE